MNFDSIIIFDNSADCLNERSYFWCHLVRSRSTWCRWAWIGRIRRIPIISIIIIISSVISTISTVTVTSSGIWRSWSVRYSWSIWGRNRRNEWSKQRFSKPWLRWERMIWVWGEPYFGFGPRTGTIYTLFFEWTNEQIVFIIESRALSGMIDIFWGWGVCWSFGIETIQRINKTCSLGVQGSVTSLGSCSHSEVRKTIVRIYC